MASLRVHTLGKCPPVHVSSLELPAFTPFVHEVIKNTNVCMLFMPCDPLKFPTVLRSCWWPPLVSVSTMFGEKFSSRGPSTADLRLSSDSMSSSRTLSTSLLFELERVSFMMLIVLCCSSWVALLKTRDLLKIGISTGGRRGGFVGNRVAQAGPQGWVWNWRELAYFWMSRNFLSSFFWKSSWLFFRLSESLPVSFPTKAVMRFFLKVYDTN